MRRTSDGPPRQCGAGGRRRYGICWGTLYELTKPDDDTFDQKLHDGTINPEMQRKDVARQNRILSRERVENLAPITSSRAPA